VPVDATAFEIDYVDSGHIRIGIYQSPFTAPNPREMEILDYRVGSGQLVETEQELLEKYGAYVGEYVHPANNDVFKMFIQDGSLTVEIPGKVVLSLNDPDEEGLWYSKLSNRLYFIFKKDDLGEITEMGLHQFIPLPKILVQVYAAILVKLYTFLF
jgi:DNA helicase HerA-like ATPase